MLKIKKIIAAGAMLLAYTFIGMFFLNLTFAQENLFDVKQNATIEGDKKRENAPTLFEYNETHQTTPDNPNNSRMFAPTDPQFPDATKACPPGSKIGGLDCTAGPANTTGSLFLNKYSKNLNANKVNFTRLFRTIWSYVSPTSNHHILVNGIFPLMDHVYFQQMLPPSNTTANQVVPIMNSDPGSIRAAATGTDDGQYNAGLSPEQTQTLADSNPWVNVINSSAGGAISFSNPTNMDLATRSLSNFLVDPVVDTFTGELAKMIRMKSNFRCKRKDTTGDGFYGNVESDPNWTEACAKIGEYAYMDAYAHQEGSPQGNRNVKKGKGNEEDGINLNWFQAANHCMERGGRLPRLDELTAMAEAYFLANGANPNTATSQVNIFKDFYLKDLYDRDKAEWLKGIPAVNAVGGIIYTGDFVTGQQVTPDGVIDQTKPPLVAALYIPIKDHWDNGELVCDRFLAHYRDNGQGDLNSLNLGRWTDAQICTLPVSWSPSETIYKEKLVSIFDPAAGTTEEVDSPYAVNILGTDYDYETELKSTLKTYTYCVYD